MNVDITINDPREHFVMHDSLDNVAQDLTYSIFKKYNCKAGCKICYIRDDFLPDEKFKNYIPIASKTSEKSYVDRLMDFFSYFHMVATIDDMWFVKNEHPEHFKFYQKYGEVFHLSSMTDNAVFRHLSIIENDLNVKGLREISLSEQFLHSINMRKFFDALDRIQRKAAIMKIKVIVSGGYSDQSRGDTLQAWCTDNGVMLEKQFDIGADEQALNSPLANLADARYSSDKSFSEGSTYHESDTTIFPIQSETLFLMYDSFYSDLKSATAEGYSVPFATLDDFADPIQFLGKVIAGKQIDYARYADTIQNKDNTYFKYFKFIVENLQVNQNFNFIPRVAFKPYSTYYRKIVDSGKMVDHKYGLIDPTASVIVPIYQFKDNEPK